AAYPHIHHMTKQLRKAAAQANDPQVMSLWAGQGYRLAKDMSAGEIVRLLVEEVWETIEQINGFITYD
ncbi:nitronate monooxygenase, partial [Parageobacillus thermoglucosidasius]